MIQRERRYPLEELARRGAELYERQIRAQVEAGNLGRIVAIDVETGNFELGDTSLEAGDRLLARCPDAQTWCERIGFRAVRSFGGRRIGVAR